MAAPIVIVGGGQAGLQAAESLRAEGYAGPLLIVGAEPHAPYQRPPLSKKFLGGELPLEIARQAAYAPQTGRRGNVDPCGQFLVRQRAVALQFVQDPSIGFVEIYH